MDDTLAFWSAPAKPSADGALAYAQILGAQTKAVARAQHDFQSPPARVAQISNLLYRRLPVGRQSEGRCASGLEIRDTAG